MKTGQIDLEFVRYTSNLLELAEGLYGFTDQKKWDYFRKALLRRTNDLKGVVYHQMGFQNPCAGPDSERGNDDLQHKSIG